MTLPVVVDYSHVHRPVTGIERVSLELFSHEALPELPLRHVRAKSLPGMIVAQWLTLPFGALTDRRSVFLCPGFPPSGLLTLLGGDRTIAYIHDLFLLTRPQDLNARAKYYMRPSFTVAVRHLRRFLVNSNFTGSELRKFCRADAEIRTLRPAVRDVFGLGRIFSDRPAMGEGPLRVVSIGTIEPRKNYPATAAIRSALERRLGRPVELHIVGRVGWGPHADLLRGQPGVVLHGYMPKEEVRALIRTADIFLTTSKEEGLGLPLLEVQHGGILVAASDIPVFREVLGASGCLIPADDPEAAAERIGAILVQPDWRRTHHALAAANVDAWNAQAASDKREFVVWAGHLADGVDGCRAGFHG